MFKSSIFILSFLICLVSFHSCNAKTEKKAFVIENVEGKIMLKSEDITLPSDKEQCIDYIVKNISLDTIAYLSRGVGAAGIPTLQYNLADTLLTIASENQLQEIAMNHESVVVRAAIFNALIRKYPHAAVEVAIHGLYDFTPVKTMSGCIEDIDTLSMLRVHAIVLNKEYYHINDNDYNRLDSILLFSRITKKMDSYGKLYKKLNPTPGYYQRLLSLYDKSSYTTPIIAIAKYHKAEDRKRMMELFQYVGYKKSDGLDDALQAISEWPDNAYKSYVQSVAKHFLKNKVGFTEDLYSALMCYEEKWVSPLIEASMYDYYSQWNLYSAYKDNPRPYYRELFNKCCPSYKDDKELQANSK